MKIIVKIRLDAATNEILPVEDEHTCFNKRRRVMVTTAHVNDQVVFVPADPTHQLAVFFTCARSPVGESKEPTVEQGKSLTVNGPAGRYRYSCVLSTASGLRTWPALRGGGGEVDIPKGRS